MRDRMAEVYTIQLGRGLFFINQLIHEEGVETRIIEYNIELARGVYKMAKKGNIFSLDSELSDLNALEKKFNMEITQ